jgi:hypothetical protein
MAAPTPAAWRLPGAPASVAAGTGNTWTATDSLPANVTLGVAIPLGDGRILVAGGGYDGEGSAYTLAIPQIFDPTTGHWSATSTPPWAPHVLQGQAITKLNDGRVMFLGGIEGGSPGYTTAKGYLYDATAPNGGSWTPIADYPETVASIAIGVMADGRVMTVGGGGFSEDAYIYSLGSNTWSLAKNLPYTKVAGRLLKLNDGRMFIYGGTAYNQPSSSMYVYDPVGDTWTLFPLAAGGGGVGAALLPDGRVLLVGGTGISTMLTGTYLLDTVHLTYSTAGSLHVGRTDFALVRLSNGLFLAAGGFASGGTKGAEVFDTGTNAWYSAATMVDYHEGPAAVVLGDGRVLVAGGEGQTAELYAPGDIVPPTIGTPLISLRSGATMTSTSVPIRVTWSLGDGGGSGLATVDIQRSISGGTWTSVVTASTATSLATSMTPGHTYRYRVRGRDHAGNLSPWHYSATESASIVQQTSTSVTYHGTWFSSTSTSYSGGSEKYASGAGAYATFTFTGRSVAWVTTRGTTRGQARIYVDGNLVTTIDLHLTSTQYRYVAYARTWTSSAKHTLRIVVVGTSGRPRIDVDAFEYLH